jgi:ribosome-binding ATPase YchF (GTP1/OBG family)
MLVGLVGRPSSGKSTFFKAATLADVLIAAYPFATIKPNHGKAFVRIEDLAPEFDKVSNPREGFVRDDLDGGKKGKWRFVPFDLMDVAGLVEGASEGKGLGNAFLNDLLLRTHLSILLICLAKLMGRGSLPRITIRGMILK